MNAAVLSANSELAEADVQKEKYSIIARHNFLILSDKAVPPRELFHYSICRQAAEKTNNPKLKEIIQKIVLKAFRLGINLLDTRILKESSKILQNLRAKTIAFLCSM